MEAKAVVIALWIGETKPDTFSKLIQWVLRTKYSHNAFIYQGKVWHGTISDNPKYNGFCEEPIESALAGSVVRYCRPVVTRFSDGELRGYLEARRGTPYSMSQNLAAVRPVLFDWPVLRRFFRNGKAKVNCSEVLAEICEGGHIPGIGLVLRFGDHDRVKPTDTFRVIRPAKCGHNHLLT